MRRGAPVLQRPDQRRPAIQVARQLRESDVVGVQAGDDFLADLPDRTVVVAEKERADLLLAGRPSLLTRPHERDLAADVLPEQLLGLEQIVFVVLFDDAERGRLGERAEVHGGGIDRGRDVHELQVELARGNFEVAHVAHERDIRVVDGQRQLRLIVERRLLLAGRRSGDRSGERWGMRKRRADTGDRDYSHEQSCAHSSSFDGGDQDARLHAPSRLAAACCRQPRHRHDGQPRLAATRSRMVIAACC